MLEEKFLQFEELSGKFDTLRAHLGLVEKEARRAEIERLVAGEEFWKDVQGTKPILKERTALLKFFDEWRRLLGLYEDLTAARELLKIEGDASMEAEFDENLAAFTRQLRAMEIQKLFTDPHDLSGAILSINAGTGGTEAQDWTEMLLRMYLRWAERHGYKTEIIDILPGDEAGVKSVTITVDGDYAFGQLKAEAGVHRLVRISPFDSSGRRHTSFAAVEVIPQVEDDIEIEVNEADLRIDTYRSSGCGGQKVNKTDSAVRITHIPTNIVVQCQNERSQHKNRDMAMKMLKARLYDEELKKREAERQNTYANKKEIAWGSQIRSYVLQPYKQVKDHRTDWGTGNADAVLDGEIDEFIEQYLLKTL